MKTKELPSVEYLNEILRVDKLTGELYWKERAVHHFSDGVQKTAQSKCEGWNKRYAGKPAGNKALGYLQISIDCKRYQAHRIVYKMLLGPISAGQMIDHIDGNRCNNSPSNLRLVSHSENNQNRKISRNSTTKIMGVNKFSPLGDSYWVARIYEGGKPKTLKYTADFFEACFARKSAENRLGYHANHGRSL